MAQSIIRQFSREIGRAFIRGETKVKVFSKVFRIEIVSSCEYRVTDDNGNDIGLRFTTDNGKLSFVVA